MPDYRIPEPDPREASDEADQGRWQAEVSEYEQWLREQDTFPEGRDEQFIDEH